MQLVNYAGSLRLGVWPAEMLVMLQTVLNPVKELTASAMSCSNSVDRERMPVILKFKL
jgi:hypothetical protein